MWCGYYLHPLDDRYMEQVLEIPGPAEIVETRGNNCSETL